MFSWCKRPILSIGTLCDNKDKLDELIYNNKKLYLGEG